MAGNPTLPDPSALGSILTINTKALAANFTLLAAKSAGSICGAVVKADGYGLGLDTVIPTLSAAGCATFFTAHLSEAIRVRELAPKATIHALNGLPPASSPLYHRHNITPVLGSIEEIAEWQDFVSVNPDAPPAVLHFDTGMNRLGLPMAEAAALGGKFSGPTPPFPLAFIMSHFIEGEVEHSPHTARQISAFNAVRALFPLTRASLANSSGIFMGESVRHDIARPGYALYGGNPLAGRPNPMHPVIRWQAPIIQTGFVNPGETIGYNATWTAKRPTRIATISLGYADGYPRAASSSDTLPGGLAIYAGHQSPFLGRISMDLTVIDITNIPANTIQRGTLVDLVGPDLPLEQVAATANTIGYELLTHLGRRVHRRILVES